MLKGVAKAFGQLVVPAEMPRARLATLDGLLQHKALSQSLDKPSLKSLAKLRERLGLLLAGGGEADDAAEEEHEGKALSASAILGLHRQLKASLDAKEGSAKEKHRRASLGLAEHEAGGGAAVPAAKRKLTKRGSVVALGLTPVKGAARADAGRGMLDENTARPNVAVEVS